MTPPTDIEAAVSALVAARRDGRSIDRLPEGARPESDEDALRIQDGIVELLEEEVGGWKTALPRGEDLIVAPLLASTIYRALDCPAPAYGGMARIEPEVAFVMGSDLPAEGAPYTDGDVKDAIAETRLVLEIMGGRYANPQTLPFREFLADSINNQGLLVGPEVADPFARELGSFPIAIDGPDGPLLAREGRHPNGHPLRGLVWLANFLPGRGSGLRAGQVVTTGTYAGVLEVPLSTTLDLTFGDLGRWAVKLTPASGGPG